MSIRTHGPEPCRRRVARRAWVAQNASDMGKHTGVIPHHAGKNRVVPRGVVSRWCQSAAVNQRRGHRDQGILAQLTRRPVRPQAAASDARISAT